MRAHLPFFAVACGVLLLTAALLPAIAQSVRGVEVGRIQRQSKEVQAEIADFMREVSRRGQEMGEDAAAVHAGAEANAARAASLVTGDSSQEAVDINAMLARSADVRGAQGRDQGPLFIAFASTAMPPEALRQLTLDVTRAGGIVVFRGFPENDPLLFGQRIMKALKRDDATENVGIDPRLFRAFHVEVVPTYVVTTADVDLCDGFACVSHVPPHDRIAGNVSAAYALRTFAGGGGAGAAAARVYLRRLEGPGGAG